MAYRAHGYGKTTKQIIRKWLVGFLALLVVAALIAGFLFWRDYRAGLRPVGGSGTVSVTVESGDSVKSIATDLKQNGLIRNVRAFEYYARFHKVSRYLQAGTYEISPAQSVPDIITQLTHGKVATSLVTILPGQRLDKIRGSLINQGFSEAEVDAALQPGQYEKTAIFSTKPAGANLEGYLYPDSFQRTAKTTAKDIVEQSIVQLQKQLTPQVTAGFKRQNLTLYQGLIVASIVEQEVTNQSDRAQAAQVFLKRLSVGMPLGSDVTAYYGSVLAGKGKDVTYDTPYNTRIHTGLPPTPISNVSKSSLDAVANPAQTDWLFFVTGDDGTTHFSKTVAEHEALAAKYCHKLCQE